MSQDTILHLFCWDNKFAPPFRNLIHKHFANAGHRFIIYTLPHTLIASGALTASADTVVFPSLLKNCFALSKAMHQADKIILHGLFSNHLYYILALQPWLLKKCYWIIWGGDLYNHETMQKNWRWWKDWFFRYFVIKHIGHFVTYIKGDFELAKKWYRATGAHHECLMYSSNTYQEVIVPSKTGTTKNILVGNSATPSNNHMDVFEMLLAYKNENIAIYCPLSYGDAEYAGLVAKKGTELFGDKFVPLLDFIDLENYKKLLGQIDIAIFAHKRQQGMGNTIALLGLGKKIYMRNDVTQWDFFNDLGIKLFDLNTLDLSFIDNANKQHNMDIVSEYFSEATLLQQLNSIFSR